MPSTNRLPTRALTVAILAAVFLYGGLATQTDSSSFVAAVAALPISVWLSIVLLSTLSYGLRFARWHVFIQALGYPVSARRNLEIYLAGFALTLTPGKVGETIRSVYLRPYGVPYEVSVAAFVTERLLDLVAVGALALLAVWGLTEHHFWWVGAMAACGLVLALLRFRWLEWLAARLLPQSQRQYSVQGLAAIAFLLSGQRLALSVPLSLMAWASQGVTLCLIIQAMGLNLTPVMSIAIYSVAILSGAASFIPGGLGATEVVLAVLLSQAAGVKESQAIAAALVCRGITLGLAVSLGCAAMLKIVLRQQDKP